MAVGMATSSNVFNSLFNLNAIFMESVDFERVVERRRCWVSHVRLREALFELLHEVVRFNVYHESWVVMY